jgi:hypothetical protein
MSRAYPIFFRHNRNDPSINILLIMTKRMPRKNHGGWAFEFEIRFLTLPL